MWPVISFFMYSSLEQALLESINGLLHVVSARIQLWKYNADTHVTESDVLGGNGLVNATSKDDTLTSQLGQNIGGANTLGQVDGSHGVSLVFGLGGNNLEAEVGDGLLDLVGDLNVALESLRQGLGEDLGQTGVKGVDELRRGSGEEHTSLTGSPVLHGSKVGGDRSLAVLKSGSNSSATEERDGETSRNANGLLTSSNNTIQTPLVECDLLTSNTANTIDNDKSLRRDSLHSSGECLLDFGKLRSATNLTVELGDVGTVGAQAVGKAIAKVSSAKNKGVLASLNEVGSDDIPS
ncbi:hypothetical protein HG531_010913 [Fusarium graminearum]|nr:hypothetical protein HG531_010913 [Fusarium graminearum]